jgi:hypothetical protein
MINNNQDYVRIDKSKGEDLAIIRYATPILKDPSSAIKQAQAADEKIAKGNAGLLTGDNSALIQQKKIPYSLALALAQRSFYCEYPYYSFLIQCHFYNKILA